MSSFSDGVLDVSDVNFRRNRMARHKSVASPIFQSVDGKTEAISLRRVGAAEQNY